MNHENQQTHFGFKKVATHEKSGLVREVFDNVALRYDLMNDLMSFGLHRIWKDKMISEVSFNNPAYARSNNQSYRIIDVAGGTADIAFRLLRKAKSSKVKAYVDVVDINSEMLEVGKNKALDANLFSKLNFNCADGENLPYADDQFDYYTIAFGIRNFTDITRCLKEAYRVLKSGGKFICLEFSQVNNFVLSRIYDAYSFNIIPKIGKMVAKDEASYQYLVESIRQFPDQQSFTQMIKTAGFKNAGFKNLTFGTVAIHTGYK